MSKFFRGSAGAANAAVNNIDSVFSRMAFRSKLPQRNFRFSTPAIFADISNRTAAS